MLQQRDDGGDLAKGRPTPRSRRLFRKADALLFSLSEASIDDILQAYTPRWQPAGKCPLTRRAVRALRDERPGVMQLLTVRRQATRTKFGFQFVMFVAPECSVSSVISASPTGCTTTPRDRAQGAAERIANSTAAGSSG